MSAIRDVLLHERDEHEEAMRVPIEQGGADVVDLANDKSERATLLAELRLEEAELGEVEAALERIHEGRYGVCEMTGRPISAARLKAIPWTRFSHAAALRVKQRLQR